MTFTLCGRVKPSGQRPRMLLLSSCDAVIQDAGVPRGRLLSSSVTVGYLLSVGHGGKGHKHQSQNKSLAPSLANSEAILHSLESLSITEC